MTRAALIATTLLGFAGLPCTAAPPPATQAATFTWTNPLSPVVRDPQIFAHENGVWYMTATAPPFFEKYGQTPGVKIWQSPDLVHWDDGTLVVTPKPGGWYQQRFWAPEVYKSPDDGKYYLTFNCPKGGMNANTAQSIALAVADTPTGPYRVVTDDKPLAEGNDTTIFRDDDGKTYVFRSGLSAFEVDLPHAKVVGEPFTVLAKPTPATSPATAVWDGRVNGAPAVGLEGPCVIKIVKTYYCFYSSWGRGYEIGYVTADNVRGPWTRNPDNPIYGAQDKAWAKQYKHPYTQPPGSPYRQVGHGSVFTGPDGRLWTTAHAFRDGEHQPHLVYDPMHFEDGKFGRVNPSYTAQTVPTTRP